MIGKTISCTNFRAILLVLMINAVCSAALIDSLHTLQYTNMYYNSRNGGQLRYSIYLPSGFQKTEKLPLFISMHGVGPPATFSPQYLSGNHNYDINNKQRSVLLEPFCPLDQTCWDNKGFETGNHLLDPQPTNGIRMVLEMIPYLQTELGLDPSRCYAVGASNGGYAVWDLILYKAYLFAGAIPVCGAGDKSKAERVASMAIWAFHGSADNIVPVSGSREMIKILRLMGADPCYSEYPVNHEVWVNAWADTSLLPWLFRQTRLPDSTAPSAPTGFAVMVMTGGDRLLLQWRSSSDPESKSVSYHVYRDGRWRASVKDTVMIDSGLTESTGYGYRVAAYNPCDRISANSDSVHAQTAADTKAPSILWVRSCALTNVKVRFSEKVAPSSAQAADNYQISNGITVAGAMLLPDSCSVMLTTSAMSPNTVYTLTAHGIADRARTPVTMGSASGSFTCVSTGRVFDEFWFSVPGGAIADLTGSAAYQGAPSRIDTLTGMESKAIWRYDFGSRMRGFIYPAQSGTYTFWGAGDDLFQLFISPDADPAHKKLAASIISATTAREFDLPSSQRTAPVS